MADPVVAPQPGTPEYDAAMIAKFDNVGVKADPTADEAQQPQAAVKPEGVPDKFWNAEKGVVDHAAWAKSTAELEAKFTAQQQKPAATTTPDPVKAHADAKLALEQKVAALKADTNAKPEDLAAAEKALADHPAEAPKVEAPAFSLDKFSEEYATTGKLSEESYEALAKNNYPRDIVDQYIAGIKAMAVNAENEAFALVGGKETYSKMTAWAKANLTPTQVKAYDNAMSSDPEVRNLAIRGMHQQYVAANGTEPTLLNGGNNTVTMAGYRSTQEMTAAMRDSRYGVDRAYTADVEKRVAATTAF